MSEKDIDQVEPAAIENQDSPHNVIHTPSEPGNNPPVWVWFSVGGLLIVALLVIFVLPAVVTEYELPLERRVDVAELLPAPAQVDPANTISPFEEAQRSLQRKEAQDVLAELLGIQGELEALEVERWGQEAYLAALEEASIGDEYYRTQDFVSAIQSYSGGRDSLAALRETIPTVLSRTLVDAQNALDRQESATAQDLFSLALLLEPGNATAAIGLERSRAQDQVNGLLARAEDLQDDGELTAALEIYQQILDLDSYHERAREKLGEVATLIREQEFAGIMSSGYALLERGEPEQAIAEFRRAASMGINQEQALAAITQTETEVANARINTIRELIAAAEADEQWQAAVDEYDKVLAIDSNLLFAINGRDYAAKRAQLNRLLEGSIDNPERFNDDGVYQQTLDVYFTGRAIENPGPVLSGQLQELQALLEVSQVPEEVQLVSDNLTDVTLLRIGELGMFQQTSLTLKPGRYVAVGRRIGYREVRQEFVVGFGQTPNAVVVQCEERVVATNR